MIPEWAPQDRGHDVAPATVDWRSESIHGQQVFNRGDFMACTGLKHTHPDSSPNAPLLPFRPARLGIPNFLGTRLIEILSGDRANPTLRLDSRSSHSTGIPVGGRIHAVRATAGDQG